MNKYIFTHVSESETITLETEAVTLTQLLEAYSRFLRGCGYVLDEGSLIVHRSEDKE